MSKTETYSRILQMLNSIYDPELGRETNLCQLLAVLKHELGVYWIGFYVNRDNRLLLSQFQGEIACTKIDWGKGVCGTAAAQGKTQIVSDVTAFPGYIACHAAPKSEIVIPGFHDGKVAFVLDVDSVEEAHFDEVDREWLEKVVRFVEEKELLAQETLR